MTAKPWYIGAQNDGLYIIDRPPSASGTDRSASEADADLPTRVIAGPIEVAQAAEVTARVDRHNAVLRRRGMAMDGRA